jgi:bifunctional non-homologous end joining protein LigD
MKLKDYRKKRDFKITPEPQGGGEAQPSSGKAFAYVIQKHQASHLHYDFRLEWDGVLLSWAVPKGPSLDPSIKRLAMQVEDHPIEYGSFEGVIPEGEYGGGTVMVWDRGTWTPEVADVKAALEKGDLKFTLNGAKLKGSWVLVRTRGFGGSQRASWLLIKHRDLFASTRDVTVDEPRSASTGRLLAEIAQVGGGNIEKAAAGDPPAAKRADAKKADVKKAKAGARKPGPARRTSRKRVQSK